MATRASFPWDYLTLKLLVSEDSRNFRNFDNTYTTRPYKTCIRCNKIAGMARIFSYFSGMQSVQHCRYLVHCSLQKGNFPASSAKSLQSVKASGCRSQLDSKFYPKETIMWYLSQKSHDLPDVLLSIFVTL